MTVSFHTLGCRVNEYETQGLRELFLKHGFTENLSPEVIIINSCTVTSLADKKTRQLLRRQRRLFPNAVIALIGCMPQAAGEGTLTLPEADIILGTKDKGSVLMQVQEFLVNYRKVEVIPSVLKNTDFEPLFASKFDDSFQRAYLKIQDGCDCFCSYCAIPIARGAVRSLDLLGITRQTQALADNGYREIVLTGINLCRYGADNDADLVKAVQASALANGEFRIRLGSVEPLMLSKNDYVTLSSVKKLCPHFHLSLQSGCDETLKRMRRKYTTEQYRQTVDCIFKYFTNPSITTDIIVGFPGESEQEFQETCDFVRKLPLLRAHIFEYSKRDNTQAAKMENQIPPTVKKQRAKIISAICKERSSAFFKTQINTVATVIVEGSGEGYTENYLHISFEEGSTMPLPSESVKVKIIDTAPQGCIGRMV